MRKRVPTMLMAGTFVVAAALAVTLVGHADLTAPSDVAVRAGVLPVLLVGWLVAYRAGTRRFAAQQLVVSSASPALHDTLTGLANQHLFADRVAHALHRRTDTPQPLVVLYCDLDDFGALNDRLGQEAGDAVLVEVAARIQAVARDGDTAARIGSDEFAVLMEDTDMATAAALADRLQHELAEVFAVAGSPERINVSVGLAEAVPGRDSGMQTLRDADAALVWAKDQGKATIAVFESGLPARARERLELRAELAEAVGLGQLVLHYQPTIDLDSHMITGFEALVRWNHPTRGLLPPSQFVPMAEQSDLILEVGRWVLEEACRAGASLQSELHQPSMSVNIAARQLASESFVAQVQHALDTSGLPADRLVLEITETVVLHDMAGAVRRLSALRALGVRIAIDDFGTGYNSLSYLVQLPVDMLKVDKTFVDHVGADEHGTTVAHGIIAMSHTMKLRTVAEGVELPEQASWLRTVNCTLGQGYLWSRAVELDAARELLERGPLPVPV